MLDQEFEYLKQNLEEFDDFKKKHAKYKNIITEQQRGILNEHNSEKKSSSNFYYYSQQCFLICLSTSTYAMHGS